MGIGCSTAQEDNKKLIFSGAEDDYALDLERYRRITFGVNSMTVSNPDDENDKIELLYSAFNRIRVDKTIITGIETGWISDFLLVYNSDSKSIKIETQENENYLIGIFNLDGTLLYHKSLRGNQDLSMESLQTGIYIAVVTSEKGTQKIKFIR